MKKILKNRLFVFILGGLIFTSIGVYAGMSAKEIPYKINDKETNVEDALNELHDFYNSGDALESDIVSGKTAIVNGKKLTGTHEEKKDFEYDVLVNNITNSNHYIKTTFTNCLQYRVIVAFYDYDTTGAYGISCTSNCNVVLKTQRRFGSLAVSDAIAFIVPTADTISFKYGTSISWLEYVIGIK